MISLGHHDQGPKLREENSMVTLQSRDGGCNTRSSLAKGKKKDTGRGVNLDNASQVSSSDDAQMDEGSNIRQEYPALTIFFHFHSPSFHFLYHFVCFLLLIFSPSFQSYVIMESLLDLYLPDSGSPLHFLPFLSPRTSHTPRTTPHIVSNKKMFT
jgi:hypothetical protein